METLNLDLLPEKGKEEAKKIFENLLKKYNVKSNKKNLDELSEFFDKFNLDITFNRDEANAR